MEVEVISRASADCKRQSVLKADGNGDMMEPLHNQSRHKATTAMFPIKGMLFLDTGKICLKNLLSCETRIYEYMKHIPCLVCVCC